MRTEICQGIYIIPTALLRGTQARRKGDGRMKKSTQKHNVKGGFTSEEWPRIMKIAEWLVENKSIICMGNIS